MKSFCTTGTRTRSLTVKRLAVCLRGLDEIAVAQGHGLRAQDARPPRPSGDSQHEGDHPERRILEEGRDHDD